MESVDIGSKIQEFRMSKNLTIKDLAQKSGITSSMLSQIEKKQTNPSINTLKQISIALEVPLFFFFMGDEEKEHKIVHPNNRKRIGFPDQNEFKYELLTPDTNGTIEFCLMTIPPNNIHPNDISHIGEEVAYIMYGEVSLYLDSVEYIMCKGDSIRIKANVKHKWINSSNDKAIVIFAITPPTF
ncbi:helix-turn-helix domain-containing protein [Abyssisolibacter fermentans]|uniref:helix-turn-helix domain-containing protein n=1 Tax=Abyssisolibacter fermentans TaxID=1766203 RepID=UPI00082E8374|nr:helix-turn-helix domain-containing protein [Abyssisolibacter fermentans]